MRFATIVSMFVLACGSLALAGQTLRVGPGQTYALPSQAFKAAKDGDCVEIDAAGVYQGDVAYIRAKNLTVRGVNGRPKIDAKGKSAGDKGLWVQAADNLTVENVELIGSRAGSGNGAGIRAQGVGLTVRGCRFYDCQDGIQGGAGEILIEFCEFDHCGHNDRPATHSAYISAACTRLTFRYNYSTFTHEGHLLKTRARESWVLYNRLTDESGTGSAVADFPNGGLVVLVGNSLHKGPKGQNNRCIAFGMEGLRHERNEIYVVNNTMWWDNRRPKEAWFVRIETRGPKPPAGAPATQPQTLPVKAVVRNNVCVGPIALSNYGDVQAEGNLMFKTAPEAGFVDAAKFDFHVRPDSPCVDKAVEPGKVGDVSLVPVDQYVHPHSKQKRPATGPLDVGAFEFAPGKQ